MIWLLDVTVLSMSATTETTVLPSRRRITEKPCASVRLTTSVSGTNSRRVFFKDSCRRAAVPSSSIILANPNGHLFIAFGKPPGDVALEGIADLPGCTFHRETERPAARCQFNQQFRLAVGKIILNSAGSRERRQFLLQLPCAACFSILKRCAGQTDIEIPPGRTAAPLGNRNAGDAWNLRNSCPPRIHNGRRPDSCAPRTG
jgi:hypothetical protein